MKSPSDEAQAAAEQEGQRILEQLGFDKIRQRGSHIFFRHPDGRTTILPIHRGEDIGRGLLQEIIKDTKLTKEEFLKYLD